MRSLSRVYDFIAFHGMTGVFFLGSFVFNVLCLVALALPSRRSQASRGQRARRVVGGLARTLMKWTQCFGIITVSKPVLPPVRDGVGCIWVMNHPSILDGVYLLTFIPNAVFIYKKSIRRNPFYGGIARLAGYIASEGGPDVIRSAVECLRRGENVIIFPEGTRSTRLNLDQFKFGFALVAKRTGAPVVALWSDNPADCLTRESPKWRAPALPAWVSIRILGTVVCGERESATELGQRIGQMYSAALGNANPCQPC